MGAASLEPMPPATPLANAQAVAPAPGFLERGHSRSCPAAAGAVSFQPTAQLAAADPSLVQQALQVLEEQDSAVSGAGRADGRGRPAYRMLGLGGLPGPQVSCGV